MSIRRTNVAITYNFRVLGEEADKYAKTSRFKTNLAKLKQTLN